MGKRSSFGSSDLRRRQASLEPKARLLVICEGEKTEPRYLKSFTEAIGNGLVEVEIIGQGTDPKSLVEHAVTRKRQSDEFDQIWCVCDVDDHTTLAAAKNQARDNDIFLAISNPCFELWGVIHQQAQNAYIKKEDVKRLCRRLLPDYKRTGILPFEKILPAYENAVERARSLDHLHTKNETLDNNPSTGIYLLTEEIKQNGRDAHLRRIADIRSNLRSGR